MGMRNLSGGVVEDVGASPHIGGVGHHKLRLHECRYVVLVVNSTLLRGMYLQNRAHTLHIYARVHSIDVNSVG